MKWRLAILLLALCLVSRNSEAVMYQKGDGKDYTTDANFQWGYTMNVDESPIQDLGTNDYDLALKGANEPDYLVVEDNTGGYLFDGSDDYCNKDVADTKVEAYPFTLYARCKVSSTATDDGCLVFVGDKDATNIMYCITFRETGNATICAYNKTYYQTSSTNTYSLDSWHTVVGVFVDATHRYLYVDGVLDGTGTDSVTMNTAVDRIGIGMYLDSSPSQPFKGEIGEVAAFSDALTQAEISEISEKGLRGYRL